MTDVVIINYVNKQKLHECSGVHNIPNAQEILMLESGRYLVNERIFDFEQGVVYIYVAPDRRR